MYLFRQYLKITSEVPTKTIYENDMWKSQYKKDLKERLGLMGCYFWVDKKSPSQQ